MTDENLEHVNEEELVEEYVDFDAEPEQATQVEEPVVDDLPEKYQGKTASEIAKMHQEAEKMMGRQSSEVGELRKIVDDFVKVQLQTQQSQQQEDFYEDTDEELDFFEDPDKAIDRAIRNHPKVKQAEQVTAQLQQQETVAKLRATHPDFPEIVGSADFQEWVSKSKVRTQLLQAADQQYNFDAADELLSSWKERKSIVSEAAKTETTARKAQVKAASTGTAKGSGEARSRKVYRRADIIKLMQTDPDRYMSLAGEIRQAYAEGRVK